jgi:hypothetical protein
VPIDDARAKKRQKFISRFVDVEAEEASDIDEDEEGDDEEGRAIRTQQHDSQFYKPEELKPRTGGLNTGFLTGMEERYRDTVQEDDEIDEEDEEMEVQERGDMLQR